LYSARKLNLKSALRRIIAEPPVQAFLPGLAHFSLEGGIFS